MKPPVIRKKYTETGTPMNETLTQTKELSPEDRSNWKADIAVYVVK